MTYIVSSGALNSTHSLTLLITDPEGMEGWVCLVGWPIADTYQMSNTD